METSITFPGIAAIVPAARRLVRGILESSPQAPDAELVAAELVSNAIRHTASGADGGQFTITIASKPGWARIEVTDEGTGRWHPQPGDTGDDYGRGLALVAALSNRFGHDVAGDGTQTAWAEITWPEREGDEA